MALFEKKGAKAGDSTPGKPNAAASRWRKKAEEAEEGRKRQALKGRVAKKHLMATAHHGGQAATTLAVATASSYAEGRYGREKMEVAGYDARKPVGVALMLLGLGMEGFSKEHSGTGTAGGYVTAAGLGAVTAATCSASLRAGEKARAEAEKGKPAAGATAPKGNEAALLDELRATPEKPGPAQGDRRGRQKRRIDPDHRNPEMPPHLRQMLERRARARRAA